eukprot:gene8013-16411_t
MREFYQILAVLSTIQNCCAFYQVENSHGIIKFKTSNKPSELYMRENDNNDFLCSSFSMPTFKQARIALTSTMVALTCFPPIGNTASSSPSQLEQSMVALENAETKPEVLQGLADVFEAANSKTLLVRTKYKTRIINAINVKHVKLSNEWNQPLSYASGELKRRVDPYRTVDLKGYLTVAPFVGGAAYLGALGVQQLLPELFGFAYPLAVFIFAAPAIFIVLTT